MAASSGAFVLFDIGIAQTWAKASPAVVPFVCFDCAFLPGGVGNSVAGEEPPDGTKVSGSH
jgi:hypothetical protein